MPTNPVLLQRNLVDLATLTDSPAMSTGLPVTNLQTQERKLTARSTSTASQQIKMSWATFQSANMLWLARHNLGPAATWRLQLYANTDWTGTNVYDSTAVALFNPSGHAPGDVFTDLNFRILKNSELYFALQSANFRSAILTLADVANPDTWLEASMVGVGVYWELGYQLPWGNAESKVVDLGSQERTDGASLISDAGENFLKFNLQQSNFKQATDWPQLLSASRDLGSIKPFWFSMYPGDATYKGVYHRGVMKFTDSPAWNRSKYTLVDAPLVMEQI